MSNRWLRGGGKAVILNIKFNKVRMRDNIVRAVGDNDIKEMAEYIGVTPAAVYHWLEGVSVPCLVTAYKVAKYLNVSLDSLMEGVCNE